MKLTIRNLTLSALACGIVGCGSSSNSNDNTSNTNDMSSLTGQGAFIDSPVSGLSYEVFGSEDMLVAQGITDSEGQFDYPSTISDGATITFSIGTQSLGSAPLADIVTPMNLFSPADHPDAGINLTRFLQTIDEDSDPSNGIEITQSTVDSVEDAYLNNPAINFNQGSAAFEADISPDLPQYASTDLVSTEDALDHLGQTLAGIEDIILDLSGSTWRGEIYQIDEFYLDENDNWILSNSCGSYENGTGMYLLETYGDNQVVGEIADFIEVSSCEVGDATSETYSYNENTICPSRYCQYNDLNSAGPDEWDGVDQRYEQVTKRHIPGSDTVFSVKTTTFPPGYGHGDGYTRHITYTTYQRL